MNYRTRAKQVGLVTVMALTSLNIWTGAPLLGLWVGSRVAGDYTGSMLGILAFVATLAVLAWALLRVLALLNLRYERLIGRDRVVRRQLPWLRSMRGERPHDPTSPGSGLSAMEYVVVGTVALCYLAFEIWFFFYSGSSIDQRSGR